MHLLARTKPWAVKSADLLMLAWRIPKHSLNIKGGLQAKKYDTAVAIMGRNGWWDKLNQVVGQLAGQDPAEKAALRMCAAFFKRAGQTQFAKETYVKLQDHQVGGLACSMCSPQVAAHVCTIADA